MAFDGVVTRAVAHELVCLKGARIARIHQPHTSDIVLQIRSQRGNQKLLLSANPTYPRIHLTTEEFTNPQEAPMFCMLLRKHCEGGQIEAIRQVDMERIIHIDVKSRDELGDTTRKRIIVEIMGKHSNIILVDPETNIILDSAQHVTLAMSQHRQVVPGRSYLSPPDQGKRNPLEITEQQFITSIDWNGGKLDKQIVNLCSGISPLLAKEIVHRAGLSTREKIWAAFYALMQQVKQHHYAPTILDQQEKSFFSVTELTHLAGSSTRFETVSQCLQAYYAGKAMRDVVKQKVHDLIRIVTSEKNKNEKKIEKLEQTLVDAKEAERFRLFGELIIANLHLIKRGDSQLVAVNWYDENSATVTIPLDPLKTPSENLQSYYKRYNKAKNSMQVVNEQISNAREEIAYLEGLLVQLEHATVLEAEEIRDELVEQGYVRYRKRRGMKKKKEIRPEPDQYYSREGIAILVGKNNKQNDYLTNKLASPGDTWLHTKDIPGSHVVIRARDFSDETLLEAARLAAYFSKAKQGNQVPVDYTLVKHVKKPSGSKPGFCIYEQQRTLYVTPPDEAYIQQLRNRRPAEKEETHTEQP